MHYLLYVTYFINVTHAYASGWPLFKTYWLKFRFGIISLPCRRTGRVLYLTRFFFLLLLSSSSFFFFFLLATHLFHTLPYIWFWPNLLTVTGTLTTTHTLKMVGPGSLWGHWGQKGHFHQKGIKSFRLRSIDAWLMHMHKLDPLYKVMVLKIN